jgi:hypothetical protein
MVWSAVSSALKSCERSVWRDSTDSLYTSGCSRRQSRSPARCGRAGRNDSKSWCPKDPQGSHGLFVVSEVDKAEEEESMPAARIVKLGPLPPDDDLGFRRSRFLARGLLNHSSYASPSSRGGDHRLRHYLLGGH